MFALKRYADEMKKPLIYGDTNERERQNVLGQFRMNPLVNCICLSKVLSSVLSSISIQPLPLISATNSASSPALPLSRASFLHAPTPLH